MAKIVLIVGIGFMFMYLLPHGFINFMQLVSTYFVPVWYLIQVSIHLF